MITIDKDLLQPDGTPGLDLLTHVLSVHRKKRERLKGLQNIYERKHAICSRTRLMGLPNNRLAHDLPGYIVTMSAGYLVGSPVSYAPPEGKKEAFGVIADALKATMSDNVDAELAVDAAVYGKGVEICYADGDAKPRIAQVDPLDSFVVYDDTVERNPLFGVLLRKVQGRDLRERKEIVTLLTSAETIVYERVSKEKPKEVNRHPHYFDAVPVTEYWNNSREEGDFEPVMDLIDAYDALQSDRVNDKQQFTDSILALYGIGALSADDADEDEQENEDGPSPAPRQTMTPSQRLRQTKTLFMPADGAKAEWLTKPLSESDTEVLRKSLKDDIHKLCFVPDLSDENFAGNASGVAMRYKLLGLEQLTKIKERWFREGLRSRLRLFAAFLEKRGAAAVDVDTVQISFKRSLPVNEIEIAQMIQSYDGIVPQELLLSQVPFVENPQEALEMLRQEQAEDEERRRAPVEPLPFREKKDEASNEPGPERDGE